MTEALLKISGKPSGYEAVQPSLVGFLFGTDSYLYNFVLDKPITRPDGASVAVIPIRIDSFFRCPTFDNMNVDIGGTFDADGIFRAHYAKVKDSGVLIRGVRRFGFLGSVLLGLISFLLAALLFGSIVNIVGPYIQGQISPDKDSNGFILIQIICQFLAVAIVAVPTWIFVGATVIPSLYESIQRLTTKLVTYPGE